MGRVNGAPLTLWEARCEFTSAFSQLVAWAGDDAAMSGYRVALGEGLVAVTDAADGDYDGPHMRGGAHYTGLGMDLIVYDAHGNPVLDGAHRTYSALGATWRRLHYLARWGGDFAAKPDPDHFSFGWDGKA